MSCGVGCRHSLDLALLWLWHRPAATAPIGPLAWEPPYAAGVAQKSKKKKFHVTLGVHGLLALSLKKKKIIIAAFKIFWQNKELAPSCAFPNTLENVLVLASSLCDQQHSPRNFQDAADDPCSMGLPSATGGF